MNPALRLTFGGAESDTINFSALSLLGDDEEFPECRKFRDAVNQHIQDTQKLIDSINKSFSVVYDETLLKKELSKAFEAEAEGARIHVDTEADVDAPVNQLVSPLAQQR
jgi:hypothetical protein